MVVTICFVDDPLRAFQEAFRVIRPGGCIAAGFVDRESAIGRAYESRNETSVFYRDARFYTTDEILDLISRTGFRDPVCMQTLIPGEDEDAIRDGYGEGSFVVLRAEKVS